MADEKFVSRMLLIGIAIVVLAILIAHYFKTKNNDTTCAPSGRWSKETFMAEPAPVNRNYNIIQEEASNNKGVVPSEPLSNEMYKAVNFTSTQNMPTDCMPRDKLTVQDLLPKDAANSKWAQVAPAGQGDVTDQNFLTAGYLTGVNTVGQSMRNANLQLRSDPPIDRISVGPWNQTTIEYDNSRRFFEIGSC